MDKRNAAGAAEPRRSLWSDSAVSEKYRLLLTVLDKIGSTNGVGDQWNVKKDSKMSLPDGSIFKMVTRVLLYIACVQARHAYQLRIYVFVWRRMNLEQLQD